ncbi:MAG TPA: HEAT repeat domain-containing protein [Thermoanaerobaculia bacterium]|nr:HEAT repeat domain-containing protein [Thermoanaerobaculia bacterium]
MVPPILSTLGAMKPPPDRWVDTLLGYLGSSHPRVRGSAVGLLGRQTAAADVRKWAPAVARLAKDPDADVRGSVISTLGEGKGLAHDGLPALLQIVSSEKDDALRARAADVVGEIADAKYPIEGAIKSSMAKDALPVLTAAVESDRSDDVRVNALNSLSKLQIEPSAVVPVLARAAVHGGTTGFRTDALIKLAHHGRDAAQVRALIEPLVTDPDPLVAKIAKSTLESMTSKIVTTSQKPVTPAAAAPDPATRERGLAFLRESGTSFTDGMFARALQDFEEETVKAFLDAGMSPNQRFRYGELPLQTVLDSNHQCGAEMKALVNLLLDRGADANGSDDNGNTVLMAAARKCDGEMVPMLIRGGAKATAKNTMGSTAIEQAIASGNKPAAAALVAAGARLSEEKAKMYRETYKKSPKVLEIISMATKR